MEAFSSIPTCVFSSSGSFTSLLHHEQNNTDEEKQLIFSVAFENSGKESPENESLSKSVFS